MNYRAYYQTDYSDPELSGLHNCDLLLFMVKSGSALLPANILGSLKWTHEYGPRVHSGVEKYSFSKTSTGNDAENVSSDGWTILFYLIFMCNFKFTEIGSLLAQ